MGVEAWKAFGTRPPRGVADRLPIGPDRPRSSPRTLRIRGSIGASTSPSCRIGSRSATPRRSSCDASRRPSKPQHPSLNDLAGLGGWPWATTLTLNGTHFTTAPRFTYVDDTSPHNLVNTARFVIVEGTPPGWFRLKGAKLLGEWTRAGGGPKVVLYDRGDLAH